MEPPNEGGSAAQQDVGSSGCETEPVIDKKNEQKTLPEHDHRLDDETRRRISSNKVYLITNLNAAPCIDFLQSRGLINPDMYDALESKKSNPREQVNDLLFLVGRSTRLFSAFILALQESNQQAVIDLLTAKAEMETAVTAPAHCGFLSGIKDRHQLIIQNLRFEDNFLQHLEVRQVLTTPQVDELMSIVTRRDRAQRLLRLLEKGEMAEMTRGLVSALYKTDQPHLALLIETGDDSEIISMQLKSDAKDQKLEIMAKVRRHIPQASLSTLLSSLEDNRILTPAQSEVVQAAGTTELQCQQLVDIVTCRPWSVVRDSLVTDTQTSQVTFRFPAMEGTITDKDRDMPLEIRKRINGNRVYLIQHLKPGPIIDYLQSRGLINTDISDSLEYKKTSPKEHVLSLCELVGRSSGLYEAFINALRDTNQHAVADRLGPMEYSATVSRGPGRLLSEGKDNYHLLIDNIMFHGNFLTLLEGKTVITANQVDELMAIPARRDRTMKLLRLIEKRETVERTRGLISALHETEQPHLARLIEEGDESDILPKDVKESIHKTQVYEWIRETIKSHSLASVLFKLVEDKIITSFQSDSVQAIVDPEEQCRRLVDIIICRPWSIVRQGLPAGQGTTAVGFSFLPLGTGQWTTQEPLPSTSGSSVKSKKSPPAKGPRGSKSTTIPLKRARIDEIGQAATSYQTAEKHAASLSLGKIIDHNRVYLEDQLKTGRLILCLHKKNLLTSDQQDELEKLPTCMQIEKLLDILRQVTTNKFDEFIEVLKEDNQLHVARRLTSDDNFEFTGRRFPGGPPIPPDIADESIKCLGNVIVNNKWGILEGYEYGSLILCQTFGTTDDLKSFKDALRKGDYLRHCQDLVATKDPGTELDTVRIKHVPPQAFDAVESYLEADVLPGDINLTFCRNKGHCFWTADRNNWQTTDKILVQEGEYKGRKPRPEDVKQLEDCNVYNSKPKDGTCDLCKNASNHPEGAPVLKADFFAFNGIKLHVLWEDEITWNIKQNITSIPVKKSTAKFIVEKNNARAYDMTGPYKGKAGIIAVHRFSHDSLRPIQAYIKDAENLAALWNGVGFNVYIPEKCDEGMLPTALQIYLAVKKFAENLLVADKCAILIILTHGGDGFLYGSDKTIIKPKRLLHLLGAENCANMDNKPKIFIFHACREEQLGTKEGVDTWLDNSGLTGRTDPNHLSDQIVCFSCMPGRKSYFNTESIYIRHFVATFAQLACEENIDGMLKMVNSEVRKEALTDSNIPVKQMCPYESSLMKEIFFFPMSHQNQNSGSEGNNVKRKKKADGITGTTPNGLQSLPEGRDDQSKDGPAPMEIL